MIGHVYALPNRVQVCFVMLSIHLDIDRGMSMNFDHLGNPGELLLYELVKEWS